MPALHLLFQAKGDALPREVPPLLTYHYLEGEVEKQVSQFPFQLVRVPSPNGIDHLLRLLQEVGNEGLGGLGRVPGAVFSQESHQDQGSIQNPVQRPGLWQGVRDRVLQGLRILAVIGWGHNGGFSIMPDTPWFSMRHGSLAPLAAPVFFRIFRPSCQLMREPEPGWICPHRP
jgi:hypothetical protein